MVWSTLVSLALTAAKIGNGGKSFARLPINGRTCNVTLITSRKHAFSNTTNYNLIIEGTDVMCEDIVMVDPTIRALDIPRNTVPSTDKHFRELASFTQSVLDGGFRLAADGPESPISYKTFRRDLLFEGQPLIASIAHTKYSENALDSHNRYQFDLFLFQNGKLIGALQDKCF